ncbi:MAG: hypothetical protein ACE5H2_04190, partial [Terriglobia bacterium]
MKRWSTVGLSALLAALLWLPLPAGGQRAFQIVLVLTVPSEEPVLTAALSADGRVAYAIQKSVEFGERTQRRAEVYVMVLTGKQKKKRIVRDTYLRGPRRRPMPFSVERINWSPDASKLAVELRVRRGRTAVFLFKSTGGEVKLRDRGNSMVGYGATWLADNRSVGILYEAVAPRLLHGVLLVRVEGGRMIRLFRPRNFAAVAWVPGKMQAVLVERDKDFAQPPRLLLGDLSSGEVADLGAAPDYLGGLRTTPDGERFSYFVEQNKLLVRTLRGEEAGSVAIPFARYEWLAGGGLVFLEPEKPGLPTGWLAAWDPETQASERLLPEELIQAFWVAPDGSYLAV